MNNNTNNKRIENVAINFRVRHDATSCIYIYINYYNFSYKLETQPFLIFLFQLLFLSRFYYFSLNYLLLLLLEMHKMRNKIKKHTLTTT